jgi:hypothetical protein
MAEVPPLDDSGSNRSDALKPTAVAVIRENLIVNLPPALPDNAIRMGRTAHQAQTRGGAPRFASRRRSYAFLAT